VQSSEEWGVFVIRQSFGKGVSIHIMFCIGSRTGKTDHHEKDGEEQRRREILPVKWEGQYGVAAVVFARHGVKPADDVSCKFMLW
jgi:hypothetical protein